MTKDRIARVPKEFYEEKQNKARQMGVTLKDLLDININLDKGTARVKSVNNKGRNRRFWIDLP